MKKVTEIYCWLGENPGDHESMVAASSIVEGREMLLPLMMTDNGNLKALNDMARMIHRQKGRAMRLARFQLVEVIERLPPIHHYSDPPIL